MIVVLHPEQVAQAADLAAELGVPVDEVVAELLSVALGALSQEPAA